MESAIFLVATLVFVGSCMLAYHMGIYDRHKHKYTHSGKITSAGDVLVVMRCKCGDEYTANLRLSYVNWCSIGTYKSWHPAPAKRYGDDDCWKILGIAPMSSLQMINEAYRRLAQIRHPDKGGSVDAMARLNIAAEQAKKLVK